MRAVEAAPNQSSLYRQQSVTLACSDCNQNKNSQTATEFGFPNIQFQAEKSLKAAAAVNTTRWKLLVALKATGLPVETGTGGPTKFNQAKQGYPKTHWLDAVCVGASGGAVFVLRHHALLLIRATGHQSRQMGRVDPYGFPRTQSKQGKKQKGFQTGDMVRRSGSFNISTRNRTVQGISYRYCIPLHHSDGYSYQNGAGVRTESSTPNQRLAPVKANRRFGGVSTPIFYDFECKGKQAV